MPAAMTRWLLGLAVAGLAMTLMLSQAAHAQEAAGDWRGTIAAGGSELRVVVKLKPAAAGGLQGELFSPDQSDTAFPLADIKADAGRLAFSVPQVRGTYAGQWDAARHAWVGQWTQGQPLPLVLEAGDLPKAPPIAGLDGDWQGVLDIGTTKLSLVLHVRSGAYGSTAALDSPDQLAYGLKISDLARDGQTVRFKQAMTGIAYEGTLSADGQSISGHLVQAGVTRPLDLAHRTTPVVMKRPQTPHPPYPYRTVEVAFDSAPGVRLAGTLSLPPGKGPFPVAVTITGSGPQDRDEAILGHRPFAVIADALTRRGVAVLRYDDRGFGKSTGTFATAVGEDFAVDAAAAVAFLRTRPEIDAKRIGLIGHSEGGLIAPMVAARDPRIAFIVMMAGPGAPGRVMIAAQRQAIATASGVPVEALPVYLERTAAMDEAVLAASDTAAAQVAAVKLLRAQSGGAMSDQMLAAQAAPYTTPEYRWIIGYDPQPVLRQVRCPVLAVNGSKDTQVLAAVNLPAVRAALKADRDVTVVELPGLNHLFQTAGTGAPGEYARIEETIAPVALTTIVDWVVARSKR